MRKGLQKQGERAVLEVCRSPEKGPCLQLGGSTPELQGRGAREKRLELAPEDKCLARQPGRGVVSDDALLVGVLVLLGVQRCPALFLYSFHSQPLGRIVHLPFESF